MRLDGYFQINRDTKYLKEKLGARLYESSKRLVISSPRLLVSKANKCLQIWKERGLKLEVKFQRVQFQRNSWACYA